MDRLRDELERSYAATEKAERRAAAGGVVEEGKGYPLLCCSLT